MLLLVGLGNPGARYAGNRHNIGFRAVEEIARRFGFASWRRKFQSEMAEGEVEHVKCLVQKPQTFMNNSGAAVAEAARFYKLSPSDIVVFYDEIDLAPGRFRMKKGGGAAGHNGIRSIAASAIGPDFRRARIGIGHPGRAELVHGYVLSDFYKAEADWVAALVAALSQAAPLLAQGEDEKYQTEVMRLAPAAKADPRKPATED